MAVACHHMACQRDSKVFHVNCPFVIFKAQATQDFLGIEILKKQLRLQDVDNTDDRPCKQDAGIEYVNTKVSDKKIGKSGKQ